MISGATGAIAVVIVALAISHEPEYIFATVVLGIFQGLFKLGS
jgi:SulP family sulfate permease